MSSTRLTKDNLHNPNDIDDDNIYSSKHVNTHSLNYRSSINDSNFNGNEQTNNDCHYANIPQPDKQKNNDAIPMDVTVDVSRGDGDLHAAAATNGMPADTFEIFRGSLDGRVEIQQHAATRSCSSTPIRHPRSISGELFGVESDRGSGNDGWSIKQQRRQQQQQQQHPRRERDEESWGYLKDSTPSLHIRVMTAMRQNFFLLLISLLSLDHDHSS